MAITILSQPQSHMPCYNEQFFTFSSNQTAQPNFKYRVKVTDVITGDYEFYNPAVRPDLKGAFDASVFSEINMRNYIPFNTYGWKTCVDAVRQVTVNVGEYYGSTPAYISGSNITYITWNSVKDLLEFQGWTYDDDIYDAGTPNYQYLTNNLSSGKWSTDGYYSNPEFTFSDRSCFVYVHYDSGGLLDELKINSYDENDTLIGTSYISNPDRTGADYKDRYICIDVGKKGLDNISSGDVTGTYPILAANTSYYDVIDSVNSGGSHIDRKKIKRIYIACEPRHMVYTLHYLNKRGGFDTLHCSKQSEVSASKAVTSFKKTPWSMVSDVMTYDYNVAIEQTQNVVVTDRLRLNSDNLTPEELVRHKDLFTSPVVYLDLGSTQGYAAVKVTTNDYVLRNAEKLRNLTFDIGYTHENFRQRA